MYDFAERLSGVTGSAIRQIFALLADPLIISFAGGNPSPKGFPKDALAALSMEILKNEGSAVLQYGVTAGIEQLKSTVAERLKKAGVKAGGDEIIITSGSSQGINLAARAFIDPGDTILVESPTFLGALQTFYLYQARLKSVDTDEYGLVPEHLEQSIRLYRPKFLYIIPTFQNPTGRTLGLERRKRVLEICEKHGVLILEDDPYRDLRYSGQELPAIKSFDASNHVIYLYSFSKIISPGLRVGAAVADKEIIAKFNILKQGEDIHTSNIAQALTDAYCRSGQLEGHIASVNEMYREQMQTMLDLMEELFPKEVKYTVPDGGLFIWAELHGDVDSADIFKKALEKKVVFVPGEHFYCEHPKKNTLRLNFSMATVQQIKEGMARLAQVIGASV